MKLLSFLARSSRSLLLSATVTSVLGGVGASLLVGSINESLGASDAELPVLGLRFAALGVGMLFFRWLSQSQFVRLSEVTLARLRLHLSRHFAEAPYRSIEARGSGRLLAVLTEDVNTVSEFFVTLPRFVMHGAVVLGCLGYLAWLSTQVFAFSLVVVLIGVLGHLQGARRARPHLVRGREHEDRVYGHFRALFSGAKELKLNAARRREFLSDVLGTSVEQVRAEQTRGYGMHAASASWRIFLFYVVIGGVLFVLGDALGLEARVRSGYAIVFLYMMLPLHALVEASPEISRTRVALERINALGVADGSDAPAQKTADALEGEAFRSLRLSQVRYQHRHEGDDSLFELGPIELELRPGELVFLIGGNGSGKTTLAKLLTGLYEPSAGRVQLNDRPLEPGRLEGYRQLFSAVFADFHLFQTLLGLEGEALDARAQALLELLALGHKVTVTNGVFSSTELSRGQQKRLALVVATLEDRPVYVFDEWAADQDPAYKDVFYRRILPELKARGKSLFVITHDDRFFHLADRCLKLDSGTLREVDPHSAALAAHEPTHSVHDVRKDLALGVLP